MKFVLNTIGIVILWLVMVSVLGAITSYSQKMTPVGVSKEPQQVDEEMFRKLYVAP